MTKKEIVKAISEQMKLTQLQTKEIVQKTFEAIVDTLVTEGRIELRNFGVFEVKKRAARKARNPRTGDRVNVPEKYVVTFKPGKRMEEEVRKLEERDALAQAQQESAAAAPSPGPAPTPNPAPITDSQDAPSSSPTDVSSPDPMGPGPNSST